MRRIGLIILFICLSIYVPAEIINATSEFYLELTKIGQSTFGFCSSNSALTQNPAELVDGIKFPLWNSSSTIQPESPPSTTFGIYWDLYTETDASISMNVSFSASESNAYEYMLRNADLSASVLNFSVSGDIYENRVGSGVSIEDSIEVPIDMITSNSFTDRTIDIFQKDVKAFDRLYGSAILNLVLNFPYDGDAPTNFQGGEYNGYAILTLNIN